MDREVLEEREWGGSRGEGVEREKGGGGEMEGAWDQGEGGGGEGKGGRFRSYKECSGVLREVLGKEGVVREGGGEGGVGWRVREGGEGVKTVQPRLGDPTSIHA